MEFKRLVLDWFFILMLIIGVGMTASSICAYGFESNVTLGSGFLITISTLYLFLFTEILTGLRGY